MNWEQEKVVETGSIRATRVDCIDDSSRIVFIQWAIITREEGEPIFRIIKGGVTGYESFYVDQFFSPEGEFRPNRANHSFYLCAGTPSRWDSLYISSDDVWQIEEPIRRAWEE